MQIAAIEDAFGAGGKRKKKREENGEKAKAHEIEMCANDYNCFGLCAVFSITAGKPLMRYILTVAPRN